MFVAEQSYCETTIRILFGSVSVLAYITLLFADQIEAG
jgi:hypothetical protein